MNNLDNNNPPYLLCAFTKSAYLRFQTSQEHIATDEKRSSVEKFYKKAGEKYPTQFVSIGVFQKFPSIENAFYSYAKENSMSDGYVAVLNKECVLPKIKVWASCDIQDASKRQNIPLKVAPNGMSSNMKLTELIAAVNSVKYLNEYAEARLHESLHWSDVIEWKTLNEFI